MFETAINNIVNWNFSWRTNAFSSVFDAAEETKEEVNDTMENVEEEDLFWWEYE